MTPASVAASLLFLFLSLFGCGFSKYLLNQFYMFTKISQNISNKKKPLRKPGVVIELQKGTNWWIFNLYNPRLVHLKVHVIHFFHSFYGPVTLRMLRPIIWLIYRHCIGLIINIEIRWCLIMFSPWKSGIKVQQKIKVTTGKDKKMKKYNKYKVIVRFIVVLIVLHFRQHLLKH